MKDDFTPIGTPKDDFTPIAAAATPKAPQQYGPARSQDTGNALTDTLGLGRKEARTPADVILRPKDWTEVAVREASLAPLTAASMPVRIGAQAGLGALERLTAGKDLSAAGLGALLDGAVAGLTEGALGIVGSKATKIAKPWLEELKNSQAAKRTFEWATRAPQEALDALRSRLPSGKWMNVPTISGAKMTPDEAVRELVKLEGNEFKQARAEIMSELSRLDKQRVTGPKPVAGTVFGQRTSPERFTPPAAPEGTKVQRAAKTTADVLGSKPTRAIADTATTVPLDEESGVPFGGIPIMAAVNGLPEAWHWLKSWVKK